MASLTKGKYFYVFWFVGDGYRRGNIHLLHVGCPVHNRSQSIVYKD